MADQEFYHYLNDLQARSKARRWPKVSAICAVLGAIYGAALVSAISKSAGAAVVIGTTAGIVALICGLQRPRFGVFLGAVARVRYGGLIFSTFSAIGGAIFGGFLGLMAVMPLGIVIVGAVGGWLPRQE